MTEIKVAMGKKEKMLEKTKKENTWAMLCHLSSFAGFFIPLGNVIAPLIIWALQKYDFPLVDDQGKESLNFQISMIIYFLVSVILSLILIGLIMMLVIAVVDIFLTIKACIAASDGEKYRYPFNLRLIK